MKTRAFCTEPLFEALRISIDQAALSDERAAQLVSLVDCAESAFEKGPISDQTVAGALDDITLTIWKELALAKLIDATDSLPVEGRKRSLTNVLRFATIIAQSFEMRTKYVPPGNRNQACVNRKCQPRDRHVCTEVPNTPDTPGGGCISSGPWPI